MPNYLTLPTTTKGLIRVVVETPRGAAAKLAYEPKTQTFDYRRPLPVGMMYPYDWGFVPSTLGDDGDPLDGLVIHQAATAPGIVIKCDLLGALRVQQTDQDGKVLRNDRYVFAPHKEDAPNELVAEDHVSDRLRGEIEQFFLSSVLGTGKTLKFEGWHGAQDALKSIRKGMKAFAARR
ncbi:inorganic pyrophosphatase [Mesorhizobium albiziae]|uniref:inorganic diphosphatase n=1 Tax=Neomesorhizobium albiziae TaxID=335020 RepID=A0A1I4D4K8_9HYPH|nr:inorganic diphosphatase [Mesorhizobium albiziae]GLS28362.1 inorganic pyrophosphatase [Mesorhizobium albiziae]SFK86961.1 inorganic pyrophosphatase [Mesorhizobium albiziae]